MNQGEVGPYVIGAMVLLMLVALVGGLLNRRRLNKGMTYRFIQFVGFAWLMGATVILAVADQIDGVAGAILGTVAGYLFGLRNDELPEQVSSKRSLTDPIVGNGD